MKSPAVLNRPYTRDTVYLVHKWAQEGMTVPQIARLLSRSEENVAAALDRPLRPAEQKSLTAFLIPRKDRRIK